MCGNITSLESILSKAPSVQAKPPDSDDDGSDWDADGGEDEDEDDSRDDSDINKNRKGTESTCMMSLILTFLSSKYTNKHLTLFFL